MRRFFSVTMLWILLLPYAMYMLGAASNHAVLIANHDRFPVLVNDTRLLERLDSGTLSVEPDGTVMLDSEHCVMTSKTHLNWLADVFDRKTYTESIGDMLLDFGIWLNSFAPFVWAALVIRKLYA